MAEIDIQTTPRYEPPVGTQLVQPHKTIMQFYPEPKAQQYGWVEPYEQRHIQAFGNFVAQIMGVDLIDDQQYRLMPELEKLKCCSVVMTRTGLDQPAVPGIFKWNPIVVVVKYCVMLALRCSLDVSNQKFTPHDCLMWDSAAKEYMLVSDGPGILMAIEKWATAERLAAWIPQIISQSPTMPRGVPL
jgi:hypothetical protein